MRNNLIVDNPFNTTTPFKNLLPIPPFRILQTTNPQISPQKFISVTVAKTDKPISGHHRSEISRPTDSTPFAGGSLVRWFGLRYYFPASYKPDPSPELIYQQHEYGGSKPPSFAIWMMAGSIWTVIDGIKRDNLGPCPLKRWVPFVFRHKFSPTGDGLIQVWKDGVERFAYPGKNMPSTDKFTPYLKFGLYKWEWLSNPKHSNCTSRNLFVDQIRIGNENATFSDVVPDNL